MPRTPRIEVAGGVHHVTARGNNHHTIFPDDAACRLFLDSFESAVETNGWLCLGYCLIPNHFHLVLETPEPNLGIGMKTFLGPYVQTLHRRLGTDGPMFKGRFRSSPVDSDEYFARLLRYVALNPVNHGLCGDPSQWPWSSHNTFIGGASASFVAIERVEDRLACWGGAAGTRYSGLLAPEGRFGTWADAVSPFPPRPTLEDLFATMDMDVAMQVARWDHGYRVFEIARFCGLSDSAVSRRTKVGDRSGTVPDLAR